MTAWPTCVLLLAASLRGLDGQAAEAARSPGPHLHARLAQPVRTALEKGLSVAEQRIRAYRACRSLFERLDADGMATIAATTYYAAGDEQESRYCRRNVHAITEVGGSRVILCRSFGRLLPAEGAILVIHEALHSAGQTEYPADPGGPDADSITRMVMKSCRLS